MREEDTCQNKYFPAYAYYHDEGRRRGAMCMWVLVKKAWKRTEAGEWEGEKGKDSDEGMLAPSSEEMPSQK